MPDRGRSERRSIQDEGGAAALSEDQDRILPACASCRPSEANSQRDRALLASPAAPERLVRTSASPALGPVAPRESPRHGSTMCSTPASGKTGKADSLRITMACGNILRRLPDLGEWWVRARRKLPRPQRPWEPCEALSPPLPKAHALGEVGARCRVVRSDHRIIVRQAPFLAIFLGREIVMRAQVPLQRFELLTVLEADDVFGRHRLFDSHRGFQFLPGRCA